MSSTPDPIDPDADFLLDPVGASGADTREESTMTDAAPAAPGDEAAAAADGESTDVEEAEGTADSEPASPEPDPRLLEAHDLALAALREVTPASTIGDPADYRVEPDGVVSLRFANRLAGYPGWFWTVSLARVEDAEPTVLEVELLPGDGALLAPDWVPWAVRLADYHAAQAAAQAEAEATGENAEAAEGDDLEDVDDLDASDFDDDGSPILHAGDVDGVDIDELADIAPDEEGDEGDDFDEDDDSGEDEDEDDDFDDEDESDDEDDSDDDDSDDDDSDDDDSDDDDSDDEDDDFEDDDFDEGDDSDDEDER